MKNQSVDVDVDYVADLDKKFDSFMVSQKFIRSEYDHCVYFKSFSGIFIILVLYVDNILIARKIVEDINRLKVHLSRTFDMKDLGVAKHILGIEVHRKMVSFGYHNISMWKEYLKSSI